MSRRDELVVDPIACSGYGLCAELFPEGIELDDWGYPMIRPEASDPRNAEHAQRAISSCPALALRIRRSSAP